MPPVVYILCLIIAIQQVMHRMERKDLYNRIMSKNLSEYKGGSPVHAVSAHKRVLDKWRRTESGDE